MWNMKKKETTFKSVWKNKFQTKKIQLHHVHFDDLFLHLEV